MEKYNSLQLFVSDLVLLDVVLGSKQNFFALFMLHQSKLLKDQQIFNEVSELAILIQMVVTIINHKIIQLLHSWSVILKHFFHDFQQKNFIAEIYFERHAWSFFKDLFGDQICISIGLFLIVIVDVIEDVKVVFKS